MAANPHELSACSSDQLPSDVTDRLFPFALNAFAENDFHAVGMRDICAGSGVSTATIYKYFGSKEALLFSILRKELSAIDVKVQAAAARAETAKEKWRACFQELMGHYDANPDFATAYFITVPTKMWISEGSWASFGPSEFLQHLARLQRRSGELDASVSPSMAASLVFVLLSREVQLWFYRKNGWRLSSRVDRMTDLFWRAVQCADSAIAASEEPESGALARSPARATTRTKKPLR